MSSILPKNERKQFDLRYFSSKVEFFRSFFGRIEDYKKDISKFNGPLLNRLLAGQYGIWMKIMDKKFRIKVSFTYHT